MSMSNVELSYDQLPIVDGELELSDNRQSCQLFLASLLDHACAERVEQVCFNPTEEDKCLAVVIGREICEIVPIPQEVRATYLRHIQEMILGKFAYVFLVRLCGKPFIRNNCGPVIVDVGGRRSKWTVECARDLVRFVRVS
jgi:hypothetical protein